MHGLARSGSYLQMDTDGRVIRVDSFAKFLAPGLRLGWVTAHPKIVEKLTMIIQVKSESPVGAFLGFTLQLLVLLSRGAGVDNGAADGDAAVGCPRGCSVSNGLHSCSLPRLTTQAAFLPPQPMCCSRTLWGPAR